MQAFNYPVILYKYIPFFRYIEYDDYTKGNCIKGFFHQNELGNNFQFKGYSSNTYDTLMDINPILKHKCLKINDTSFTVLKTIVEICKQNNIILTFTHGPEYKQWNEHNYINYERILNSIHSFANQYQIKYLRHDTISEFNKSFYYRNIAHLNTQGATAYSVFLAKEIKKNLK
jgi:hypothetical protein